MDTTSSTVILKRPEHVAEPSIEKKGNTHRLEQSPRLVSLCIWILTTIVSAGDVKTSANNLGIAVTFIVGDILLLLSCTLLLLKGLSTRNHILLFPWIFFNAYKSYSLQYPGMIKMVHTIKSARLIPPMAWFALGVNVIGFAIKILLLIRICKLMVNQWYYNKLENELIQNKL